jgi:hypothetical protein
MAGNYGFTSPGAMAGNAIEQFLMQREMEERQRLLDEYERQAQEAAIRQRDEQMALQRGAQGLDRDRFTADEAERARVAGRQARADDIAEADRRQDVNKVGVRQMAAEGLRTGTADPRTAQLMAFGEGVDIPMEVLDPERDTRTQAERDALLHRQRLEEITAQGTQARQTLAVNNQPRDGQGGGRTGGPSNDYTMRSKGRLFTAIEGLEPQIGPNTVGTWRAKGARAVQGVTPGEANPTIDFDQALGQIKALIGFDELNAMRQASPTGGALGQVSERELAYLQSVAGALDPNQTEQAFRAQLAKVKAEIEQVINYGLAGGAPAPRGVGPGPGPQAPTGGVQRWGKDANGRPVRLQ